MENICSNTEEFKSLPMINKNLFCGKDPKGFYAGALDLACKIKNIGISQKEIAKVVGVTEVTLRSRYKELLQNIKLITYN